jgi:hypothetical protein
MYSLIEKISNVYTYMVDNKNIAYEDNKKGIKNKSLFLNDDCIQNRLVSGYVIKYDTLIYSTWENDTFLIDVNTLKKEKLRYEQVNQLINDEYMFNQSEGKNVLYDLKLRSEIIEITDKMKGNYYYINDGKTIISGNIDKRQICAFDIESQEMIWRFDLTELDRFALQSDKVIQLKHFFGKYKKDLVVACDNSLIITIDIHSGKLSNHWQRVEGYYVDKPKSPMPEDVELLPSTRKFSLDYEKGILFATFIDSYIHINLNSGEILYEYLQVCFEQNDINLFRSTMNPYTKDHIFCTVFMDMVSDADWIYNAIIALNRNTFKVDWVRIFNEFNLGPNTPNLSGSRLYQRDNNNTLFIMEKVA